MAAAGPTSLRSLRELRLGKPACGLSERSGQRLHAGALAEAGVRSHAKIEGRRRAVRRAGFGSPHQMRLLLSALRNPASTRAPGSNR